MKKILLLLFVALATTIGVWAEDIPIPISTSENTGGAPIPERSPIRIPLAVFFNSDTNIVKVWCEDDNIQAEIYVYDENGDILDFIITHNWDKMSKEEKDGAIHAWNEHCIG